MRKYSSEARKLAKQLLAPLTVAAVTSATYALVPAWAVETAPAAENLPSTEFALEQTDSEHADDRKEIEKVLTSIEEQWNQHSLDQVMGFYADDYINNDGLDKKAVSALTQDFWKTYPDAKSFSKVKQIRVEGNFATVESRDMANGSTAKEMPGIGTKGDLRSISEGQLYMKRVGLQWKIIGDRIDFEKVRVAFGMAKNLTATFSAPEQVKAGHSYSAKLELALPSNLTAVGSITQQQLEYPQPQPNDAWRPVEGTVLERIQTANTNNKNELLMATIGITNAARNNLMGIEFLTRRLNVVPGLEEKADPKAEKRTTAQKVEEPKPTEEKSSPLDQLRIDKVTPDKPEDAPAAKSPEEKAPGSEKAPETEKAPESAPDNK